MGFTSVTLFVRACRWRVLLDAEGAVSVSTAFWATATGYFGNNFLPVRAGELIRSLMISSRARLDLPFVLATALSERVADAIAALVGITAVLLPMLPSQIRVAGGRGASIVQSLAWWARLPSRFCRSSRPPPNASSRARHCLHRFDRDSPR